MPSVFKREHKVIGISYSMVVSTTQQILALRDVMAQGPLLAKPGDEAKAITMLTIWRVERNRTSDST